MEEVMVEKRLLEVLLPDLPGLERVEKREAGFGQEIVLVFVDGSRVSVPILGGVPAPENPQSFLGQALLRAWWLVKAEKLA
jgi:hypothetical protein